MTTLLALTVFAVGTSHAGQESIRIGLVTFLSGPAAEPIGVPARMAAEAIVESLNAGKAPVPYHLNGFSGTPLELVIIDEAGGVSRQVGEFRDLVEHQNVDFVIGYISSENCLAIAPIAEELKKLTVLLDCATPRVFEEASYKYVFRTRAHATMDAVAGARYLLQIRPDLTAYAGINPDSASGQESWNSWTAVMAVQQSDAILSSSQIPKVAAEHYGSEISALIGSRPEIIYSSLWGGDVEAFTRQAAAGGLFEKSSLLLVAGEPHLNRLAGNIPDGTIVGARGLNGIFAKPSPLNDWLRRIYKARTGRDPSYPAYSTAQALLGLKTAFEKARLQNMMQAFPMGAVRGVKEGMEKAYGMPDAVDVIAAFEHLTFNGPSGKVMMKLGNGHQAVQGTAYGTTRTVNGTVQVENIKYYPVELVQPPQGVGSTEWIKGGLRPGKW